MSQTGGFDMSKMSTASKILLGAGILYLIDLFLPWQKVDVLPGCCSLSGTHGVGILNLLLVIALIAWEVMAIMGVNVSAPKALISAGLAAAILLFTIIKIAVDSEALYLFAWIGLLLALAIGYGGWMRWQEHQAGAGMTSPPPGSVPPAPGGGGGFTA
jgi:hypothetical protein